MTHFVPKGHEVEVVHVDADSEVRGAHDGGQVAGQVSREPLFPDEQLKLWGKIS